MISGFLNPLTFGTYSTLGFGFDAAIANAEYVGTELYRNLQKDGQLPLSSKNLLDLFQQEQVLPSQI
jgi:hypothetical protein